MINRLGQIEKQFQELEEQISKPEIATDPKQLQKLAKERASLENVVYKYREYKAAAKSLEDTKAMQGETLDEEMKTMVKQEIESLEAKLEKVFELEKKADDLSDRATAPKIAQLDTINAHLTEVVNALEGNGGPPLSGNPSTPSAGQSTENPT